MHVLGGSQSTGRDTIADGRARTFIPQLPRRTPSTRLALVVPVKAEVRRGAAGRLLGFGAWGRSLGPDGRLDRLLNLSGRTTAPITWVVDPAVLDAARSVSQDNPKIDPGPDGSGDGRERVADPVRRRPRRPRPRPTAAATARARRRGRRVRAVGPGGRGPRLARGVQPAGADAHRDDRAVRRPRRGRGARHPARRALPAGPQPERGDDGGQRGRQPPAWSTRSTAGCRPRRCAPSTRTRPVLLRDQAFPEAQRPVLTRHGRAPVVLTDTTAGSGGPRPNARYAALAMRQRLLAESALHALSAERDQPLVVSTPPYWDPGSTWSDADFFAGLDQPWLRLVDLPSIVSGAGAAPGGDTSGEDHARLHPRGPQGAAPAREPAGHRAARRDRDDLRPAAPRQRHRARRARPHRHAVLVADRPRGPRPDAQPGQQHHGLRPRADAVGPHRGAVVRDDVRRGRARSRSPWSTASTRRVRVGIAAQTRSSGTEDPASTTT